MTEAAPEPGGTGSRPALRVPHLAPTQRLVTLPALRLRDAVTGAAPRLPTSVRVGQRGGRLIVRFDGRDAGLLASHRRRDAPLWEEDVFEVFLTGEDPPVRYFELELNPLGALFDARISSPHLSRATMAVDPSWDCPGLSARAGVGERSWWGIFSIPLAAIAPGSSVLAANFYRIDRGGRDEYSAWSPPLSDPADFHRPDRFGRLELSPLSS